ncbi:MAG: sigma-70 family RNA polymerase sigma factor [Lautropia sp.]
MTLVTDTQPASVPGTLYVEHEHWLRRWLFRRLGCRDDAADLTQDVFVRVLVSPQTSRLETPRAFLTTLATRVLARFWRRRDLEREWLASLAVLPERLAPSAEEILEAQELLDQLDQWLAGLKPAARQAFLLYKIDGMTHAEIAERIGKSVATVERYLRDAYLRALENRSFATDHRS